MSYHSRVVWSEGLFLQPHHFQQQERFFEHLLDQRLGAYGPHRWGVTELTLDRELLSQGKVALARAAGVQPDGTPFALPEDDEPPEPLGVPEGTQNALVYLGVPLRREGQAEFDDSDEAKRLARHLVRERDALDASQAEGGSARVKIGKLRLRLMLEREERSAYAGIAIARVVEVRADRAVILDEDYITPCVDCRAAPRLLGFLNELVGLLHHRGEALAGRLSATGQSGVAEVADFLLLQAVNRMQPYYRHLAQVGGVHPAALFGELAASAGELATFTGEGRRAPELPEYRHDALHESFTPLMQRIRQALSMVLEQNAVALDLQERGYGIRVSPIHDRRLLADAVFVLAARADMATEQLRRVFPTQVKIGPVEKIRQLVNAQMPGIGLRPLPVAPRQLPYHAGYSYFELDRSSPFFAELTNSGGFAMHIAGEFPGLALEFWAIRGGRT